MGIHSRQCLLRPVERGTRFRHPAQQGVCASFEGGGECDACARRLAGDVLSMGRDIHDLDQVAVVVVSESLFVEHLGMQLVVASLLGHVLGHPRPVSGGGRLVESVERKRHELGHLGHGPGQPGGHENGTAPFEQTS